MLYAYEKQKKVKDTDFKPVAYSKFCTDQKLIISEFTIVRDTIYVTQVR